MRLEVLGQVCVGVAPATRALYPDLAAADSVAQAGQHAQLVRDPLHAPALVHDRRAPIRSHHAIEGDAVGRVVEHDAFTVGVAAQQFERFHQRPVRGVVAAELERLKHGWEHPAVVVAVGGAQHLAHLRPERLIVRLRLAHQLPQRLLADDREDRAADRVVGMLDRGAGEREQNPALPAHRFEIGDQLLLDAIVRPRAHLVHHAEEQVDQAVGDLRDPRPAEARQQREPYLSRVRAQPRRMLRCRPGAPQRDSLLIGLGEQVGGQPDRVHPLEPRDLAQQCVQAGRAGIGAQLREQSRAATGRLARLVFGDELLQPCHSLSVKPRDRAGAEPLIRQSSCAAQQPGDPPWRPKTLLPAACQQRCALALLSQLARAHLLCQPLRQPLLVRAGRLTESGRFPDLRAVILDRSTRPRVLRKLARLDLHQAGDVLDGRRRQLRGVRGEAALQLEELQQQREPQTGRAGLVRDQLPIAVDKRPTIDQVLRLPHTSHERNPCAERRCAVASTGD